jgi:hypothetical protein
MRINAFFLLFSLLAFRVDAQYYRLQMGFKLSGNLVDNTVDGTRKFANFTDNGINGRLSLGPIADVFFNDRYAFSTGLWYTIKSVDVVVTKKFLNENFVNNPNVNIKDLSAISDYNLQYLQIPITMKLLTSEVFYKGRAYVQFGGTIDMKVAEKPINRNSNAMFQYTDSLPDRPSLFAFGDVGLLLGGGVEYQTRGSEAWVFGVTYHRGLTEITKSDFVDLAVKNSYFGFDVGYKF